MADNINWTISIQVPGGPKTSISHTISIEAYDSVKVGIPFKTTLNDPDQEVKIQPDEEAEKVNFLAIMSDHYDNALTFKANDALSTTSIKLNQPLILAGTEAVGLLDKAPTKLFFSNKTQTSAEVWVIVGRNVSKK